VPAVQPAMSITVPDPSGSVWIGVRCQQKKSKIGELRCMFTCTATTIKHVHVHCHEHNKASYISKNCISDAEEFVLKFYSSAINLQMLQIINLLQL